MKTPTKLLLQLAVATAITMGTASAALVIDYGSGFSNLSNIDLNGQAVQSGSNIAFGNGTGEAFGSFFHTVAIDTNTSFEANFSMDFAGPFFTDGITFMIQNAVTDNNLSGNQTGTGAYGYRAGAFSDFGLGWGVPESVIVHYHSFNGSNVNLATAGSGAINNSATGDTGSQISGAHTGKVTYDALTNQLIAYLDGVEKLNTTVDISSFTGNTAYFGFGSRVGVGATSPSLVTSFTLDMVPEPSSALLVAAGSLAMLARRRRS